MHYLKFAILAVSIGVGFVASAQTHTKARPKANLTAGKELYHQHCSVCHGVDGKGTPAKIGGLYDPQSIEPQRRVKPADLTVLSERNAGKFPEGRVRDSIYSKDSIPAHGTPEMPAWGDVFYSEKSNPKLLEKRVRDLTAYIESIQETKKQ
jgi:mono/diheme cytochrome c family protein